MENFSKNKKRGRPKSVIREKYEIVPDYLKPEGCSRTFMNWTYRISFLHAIGEADIDEQKIIIGSTCDEVERGGKPFPKGFKQAAEAAGRWIADGNPPQSAIEIMVDAIGKGFSFSDIAAHFRKLRLGSKEGNAYSLSLALATTVDRYLRQFPATTLEQEHEAVARLLQMIDQERQLS